MLVFELFSGLKRLWVDSNCQSECLTGFLRRHVGVLFALHLSFGLKRLTETEERYTRDRREDICWAVGNGSHLSAFCDVTKGRHPIPGVFFAAL